LSVLPFPPPARGRWTRWLERPLRSVLGLPCAPAQRPALPGWEARTTFGFSAGERGFMAAKGPAALHYRRAQGVREGCAAPAARRRRESAEAAQRPLRATCHRGAVVWPSSQLARPARDGLVAVAGLEPATRGL